MKARLLRREWGGNTTRATPRHNAAGQQLLGVLGSPGGAGALVHARQLRPLLLPNTAVANIANSFIVRRYYQLSSSSRPLNSLAPQKSTTSGPSVRFASSRFAHWKRQSSLATSFIRHCGHSARVSAMSSDRDILPDT
jgi:hypothetical protein